VYFLTAEHNAVPSITLPAYSFDNLTASSSGFNGFGAAVRGAAVAAADSGRYIQDDLMTSVFLPDDTCRPLDSSVLVGGVVPAVVGGLDQPQATASVGGSQLINVAFHEAMTSAAIDSVSEDRDVGTATLSDSVTMTSDELSEYLQTGSVLTEMQSDEFQRQLDGLIFQHVASDGATLPPTSRVQ